MPPESRPLLILVTFHVRPDRIEEWKTVHRQIWTPVGEEKECIMFDVYESKEDIGVFRLIEVWDGTKEWFENVQMKKAYYSLLWEKSKPLWTRNVQIEYLERLGEGSIYRDRYLDGATRRL